MVLALNQMKTEIAQNNAHLSALRAGSKIRVTGLDSADYETIRHDLREAIKHWVGTETAQRIDQSLFRASSNFQSSWHIEANLPKPGGVRWSTEPANALRFIVRETDSSGAVTEGSSIYYKFPLEFLEVVREPLSAPDLDWVLLPIPAEQ